MSRTDHLVMQAVAGWRLAEIDQAASRALFVHENQRVHLEVPQ